jgi:uncharacterized OB-fold protein
MSQEYTWETLSGKGHVYTYTVMHRAPDPSFQQDVPFVVALVELEEGVRMISNIVHCPWERVCIGMPVEVVYEDIDDDTALFKFAPS